MRFPARPAPDYPYGRLRGRRPMRWKRPTFAMARRRRKPLPQAPASACPPGWWPGHAHASKPVGPSPIGHRTRKTRPTPAANPMRRRRAPKAPARALWPHWKPIRGSHPKHAENINVFNVLWRSRRDSNPRYAFGAYNGLANRRLQPLGHSSGTGKAYRIYLPRSNRSARRRSGALLLA